MAKLTRAQQLSQIKEQGTHIQPQKEYAGQDGHVLPLSYNQRAMWVMQQLDPKNTSYNISLNLHISSPIDIPCLHNALQAIVDHHPVLRTNYGAVDGKPFQIILDQQDVSFKMIDAVGWTDAHLEQQLQNIQHRPFDLLTTQLWPVRLYVRGSNNFVLQVITHHIATDGWSVWMLIQEIQEAYKAIQANQPVSLRKLRCQYTDFVKWQSDMLAEKGEQLYTFWRKELAGELTALNLPIDFNDVQGLPTANASHQFILHKDITSKIRHLAHTEGTTIYKILLAALQLFLWRYSGQEDILLGTPVLGRGQRQFLRVSGCFINTIIMRMQIDPHRSFREQIPITDEKAEAALAHQDFPFALLVERLQPRRKTTHAPLVQVTFNLLRPPRRFRNLIAMSFEKTTGQEVDLGAFVASELDINTDQQIEDSGLRLDVLDLGDKLVGTFKYSANFYKEETIARMADHFQALLVAITDNPDRSMMESAQLMGDDLPYFDKNSSLSRDARGLNIKNSQVLLSEAVEEVEYVAPRTPQEEMLADLWAQVLQVERVGVHDNFFDLGGHSLLATQVISRLEQSSGVVLPLRQLFEQPTVAEMSTAVSESEPTTSITSPPAMQPVSHEKPLPLSFAQERMWFLYQLAPHDSAYHIPFIMQYHQAVDMAALQLTLNDLIARHESLCTIFISIDGVPYQKILPPFEVSINEVDLTIIPAAERETAVTKLIKADSQRSYDIAAAPPWRFTLYHLDDELYILSFTFHHIIFDQWSAAILWRDLDELYNAHRQQKPPNLVPLEIQYADFSVWQRSWLQGEPLDVMLDYWRQQLADLPTLNMPTDYPRPPIQSYNGATEFFILPDSLVEGLRALSQQSQVSLFMVMFAAFKVLLARYTEQVDIAIGVPVANRHRLIIEPIIGTFVNTLVVRTDLSGNPSFADLLERVRDVLLDAYAYQEFPFEKLVSEIIKTRDLSQTPIVQILFDMVNTPFEYERLQDVWSSSLQVERGAAQFDISVSVVLEEHFPIEPQIAIEYNTDLFSSETIQRFSSHYVTLLEAVVADSQQPISNYDILATDERQQLVQGWNQTEIAYPRQSCLHELIAEQAERRPEKTAVSFQNQSITYRQLDERSTQVAHHLQTLDVGVETIVGVFIERSVEMVVGLLGILKAGGAYLPLDPAFPSERLAFMVEDAQVDIILTQSSLMDSELVAKVAHPICLDTDWTEIAQQPITPLPVITKPENCAYIIYTSGSTGKPKGVQVEHRNVVNFLAAMRKKPGINPDDILYSVTTHSFDISVLEIFLPLISGARVVIADSLTASDGRAISKALQQYQATIMQATPTTWSMLVDAGWQGTASLRQVLCGGEALSRELANAILECDVELWNMYGPTETTVWSSIQHIQAGSGQIPIGRPIGNTSLFILDPYGRPVPIGVAGELYIGGDGVARGYLNRPELTAEKFLPNPFAGNDDARLYRTGDLARYRADGVVEYLGRTDFQVKVHGHRIELGEIEAALTAYPPAREAVVTVYSHEGDQILVAYMVLHTEAERPTITAVRDYLRQSLPDYMIPSAFVYLDAFPLTHNRKIDRKALPAPDSYRPDLDNRYVAPRNDVETVLVDILADLLGIEKVGIRDDFFELGGHSLQATRFVARVGKAFRTEIPLWTFLHAPNAADLAKYFSNTPEGERIAKIARLRVHMAQLSSEEARQLLQRKSQNVATLD